VANARVRRVSEWLQDAGRKLGRGTETAGLVSFGKREALRLAGILVLGCVFISGAGYLLVNRTVDAVLRAEAEQTAQDWAEYFTKRVSNIEAIASGEAPSAADISLIESASNMGSVFRFKLFDENGRLRLTADRTEILAAQPGTLSGHNALAARATAEGRIFVDFMSGAGKPDRPAHYFEAYVPVHRDGRAVAVVEVYVDQSVRFVRYRASATTVSIIAGLLAGFAFGAPAYALYLRSRQVARADARVHFLARHDALTGLANRTLLNERMAQAMERTLRGEMVAIHMLDLDHFKPVNDAFGHPVGDKLLRIAGERLAGVVRETDIVARVGGDEFTVLQSGLRSAGQAAALAQRIIDAMSRPYHIDGNRLLIGASVGIAMAPADGIDPDQIVRNADLALYRAKADGRANYRFFESMMHTQMQERRQLERDLRKALTAGEFELHYQPTVDLATHEVRGFEALIRWSHPEKGPISPGEFIPVAEEIGMIVPIGEWVIREACRTAARWPANLRISVNLSPVQLRSPALLSGIVGALAASGLPANRLELEITETALIENSANTIRVLHDIRELGVRVAMDDFGTGYSSLSHLQSFPFDRIKIDRSFIKDVADNASSLSIIRAVVSLARGLGVATTAEGVETTEQFAIVTSEGCTEMQGFLKSKPLPAREIERLFLMDWRLMPDKAETAAA
jgi:diguanylate cyclase (GGDEF)-like protein